MTPALLAITLLFAVTLCYVAVCAGSPFGDCRKCRGFGFATDHGPQGTAQARQDLPPLQGPRQTHTRGPPPVQRRRPHLPRRHPPLTRKEVRPWP